MVWQSEFYSFLLSLLAHLYKNIKKKVITVFKIFSTTFISPNLKYSYKAKAAYIRAKNTIVKISFRIKIPPTNFFENYYNNVFTYTEKVLKSLL